MVHPAKQAEDAIEAIIDAVNDGELAGVEKAVQKFKSLPADVRDALGVKDFYSLDSQVGQTTALCTAAEAGHVEIFKYLVEQGASMSYDGKKQNEKANAFQRELNKLSPEEKGDYRIRPAGMDYNMDLPIHIAARDGNEKLLDYITKHPEGAKTTRFLNGERHNALTALLEGDADEDKKAELADKILSAKATEHAVNPFRVNKTKDGVVIDQGNGYEYSLAYAVSMGDKELLATLLKHDAVKQDINRATPGGTALMNAVHKSTYLDGYDDIINILRSNGAKVTAADVEAAKNFPVNEDKDAEEKKDKFIKKLEEFAEKDKQASVVKGAGAEKLAANLQGAGVLISDNTQKLTQSQEDALKAAMDNKPPSKGAYLA